MKATVLVLTTLAVALVVAAGALAQDARELEPVQSPPRPPGAEVDAPEISRSVGEPGGVVLFWPRVIPADETEASQAMADQVRQQLLGIVERALPGRPVDVRPAPERVCPQAGCDAITVGVLLTRRQGGCAAVALVSGPGRSPAHLVPWAGAVRLRERVVPFRVPPEDFVTVADYAPCAALLEWLPYGEESVVEALRELGAASPTEPAER